jgi:hypothetical protein
VRKNRKVSFTLPDLPENLQGKAGKVKGTQTKIKIGLAGMVLFLSLLFPLVVPVAAFAQQTDIYGVVLPDGVQYQEEETVKETEKAVDEPLEETSDDVVAEEVTFSSDSDMLQTYLEDIRAIVLGLLFTTAFMAGCLLAHSLTGGLKG